MKSNVFIHLGISIALTTLAACGGGGGGSGSTPAPVASTQTFPLNAALANDFNSSGTWPFTVSGTTSGVRITGSGTVTEGSISSTTFEGVSALQKSVTVSMTLTGNGVTVPITDVSTSYVDTNYRPLGSLSSDEYDVVIGQPTIPTTALVNDSGTAFTANRYTSISKVTWLGTDTVTWVMLPDTASTALLKISHTVKDTGGTTTSQGIATYRMTTAGVVTKLGETLVSGTDNLVVTY